MHHLEIDHEYWESALQLYCPDIGRNSDDWAVVSVSALYGATAAAYAGKTRLRM